MRTMDAFGVLVRIEREIRERERFNAMKGEIQRQLPRLSLS
jgi:hypothetical protein